MGSKVVGRKVMGGIWGKSFSLRGWWGSGMRCLGWCWGWNASHPLKSIWMSTWHIITFRGYESSGIRRAGQCIPCLGTDSMGWKASSALLYSVTLRKQNEANELMISNDGDEQRNRLEGLNGLLSSKFLCFCDALRSGISDFTLLMWNRGARLPFF